MITVTLSKSIFLDVESLFTEQRTQFKANALTGEWLIDTHTYEKAGFKVFRAYNGDFPVDVGTFKNNELAFGELYKWSNREPLIIWFEPSLCIAEAPCEEDI